MSLTKSRPLSPLSFSSVPEDADSCWKFRPASDFKHSILIEDWEQNSIKHSLRGLTVVERGEGSYREVAFGWHCGHQNVVRASMPCFRDSIRAPHCRHGSPRRLYTHNRSSSLARPVVLRIPV